MIHTLAQQEATALHRIHARVGTVITALIVAVTHALEQTIQTQQSEISMEPVLLQIHALVLEVTKEQTVVLPQQDFYTLWEMVAVDKWEMGSNSHTSFHHLLEERYLARLFRQYQQEVNLLSLS